jgi:hypothetical protein
MEKEKECNRALEDPWGAVGVLIAQKRPYAKTGALPDQTRESKPASNFPATTLLKECGTIEFRRPPQVRNSSSNRHWIAFALCFVRHSLSYNFSTVNSAPRSETFKHDMRRAAVQLSVKNALGNWQLMGQSIQTTQLSPQGAANTKKLKKEKESKFAQKVKNLTLKQYTTNTSQASSNPTSLASSIARLSAGC